MKKNYYLIYNKFFSLFIILIPWQIRYIFFDYKINNQIWEYGRLSIYFNVIILLLALIFYLFNNPYKFKFFFNIKQWSRKSKALFLFLFYLFLISIFSNFFYISLYYFILILLVCIFIFLLKDFNKDKFFKLFLFSGLIQGLFAIYQSYSQKIIANKYLGLAEQIPERLGASVLEIDLYRILRSYGSLPHPNILGGFLFIVILIGIYLWIQFYKENYYNPNDILRNDLFRFIFIIFSIVISTIGLLLTFSRSSILALVISLLVLLIHFLFQKNYLSLQIIFKYFVILLLSFLLVNLWWPNAWISRFDFNNRLEINSIEQRLSSFKQIDLNNNTQLFLGQGLGLNTFFNYSQSQEIYEIQPIHNIFILIISEIGIIGFLLLINLFEKRKYNILSLGFIIGFIIIGLFDHYFWTSWTGLLLSGLLFYRRL